jgi:Na+-driven multidrug efflux pump
VRPVNHITHDASFLGTGTLIASTQAYGRKNHRPIADALFDGTTSQSRFRC